MRPWAAAGERETLDGAKTMRLLSNLLVRHVWLLFVVFTSAQALAWWRRGKKARERDPSLTDGYRRLIRGYLVWGNLPWVAMGVPVLLGFVPSSVSYLELNFKNPFTLAWLGLVVVIWILESHWLFLQGGAEQLTTHPGLINFKHPQPWKIKLYWLACLAGGIAGLVLLARSGIQGE